MGEDTVPETVGSMNPIMRMLAILALLALASVRAGSTGDSLEALNKDIATFLEEHSATYNCSFSIAVKTPSIPQVITAASRSTTEDKFAWGSITKMWTGASIMQLVASGKLSLTDPIAPIVDAQLAAMASSHIP